ncbi:MAG: riboflavin synthase [Deltaproteobacteria bacterium]|nr:riboflavin synthase [Deltaproteobacteria bacterium]
MFTGIVQDVGRFLRTQVRGAGRTIELATGLDVSDFQLGESVAVNGVCLTVTAAGRGSFEADVSPETLRRSNLGDLKAGSPVNLERALRPIDRLGGHFVLGHVDATGRLASRRTEGEFQVLTFEADAEVLRYLVEKGSVAVDGVSLTVSACDARTFSVAAIPHTLERTNLPALAPGGRVNLEVDVLGKYVEKLLKPSRGGSVSLELLARTGFLDSAKG